MEKDFEKEFTKMIEKDIDIDLFISYYSEIKYRLKKLSELCETFYITNTKFDLILFETICLQLRKVLELIAMSSLISNKEAFENVKTKIFKQWRAKYIIKEIKKISDFVFPEITYQHFDFNPNNIIEHYKNFTEIKENILSEDLFCEIYDTCSSFLHITNPYDKKEKQNLIFDKFSKNVGIWLDCILNTYGLCKIIPFGNERKNYLLYMGNFKDEQVYLWPGFIMW